MTISCESNVAVRLAVGRRCESLPSWGLLDVAANENALSLAGIDSAHEITQSISSRSPSHTELLVVTVVLTPNAFRKAIYRAYVQKRYG